MTGRLRLGVPARAFLALVWVWGVWLAGCAASRPPAETGSPHSSPPFIITFCCGPPLEEVDDARAAEIADAGFNVVGPPCEGTRDPAANIRALKVAERHGLKVWVQDHRLEVIRGRAAAEGEVDRAILEYREWPALAGYYVSDEPDVGELRSVAAVVSRIRALDPRRLAVVNLGADYHFPGRPAYVEYLRAALDIVAPALLSYDYYPFLEGRDRPTYFDNLGKIRSLALERGIPFLVIVQAMPHGRYRDPTEAELSWQVFHALAYGARGISYFAYWTPVHVEYFDQWKFRRGIIEHGKPTDHYFEVARLNRTLQALASELDGFRSVGVADSRGEIAPPLPAGSLAGVEGGRITVGLFSGPARESRALLVNRDYWASARVRLVMTGESPPAECLDPASSRWFRPPGAEVLLPAGGAVLCRWSAAPGGRLQW